MYPHFRKLSSTSLCVNAFISISAECATRWVHEPCPSPTGKCFNRCTSVFHNSSMGFSSGERVNRITIGKDRVHYSMGVHRLLSYRPMSLVLLLGVVGVVGVVVGPSESSASRARRQKKKIAQVKICWAKVFPLPRNE